MATTTNGRDRGARSILKHGDPYMGLLKDLLAELIRQRDKLARKVGPNDENGAPTTTTTTTITRRNLEAGNTSAHEDPYIARLEAEQDGLRRERGFGAGGTCPADNEHSAAATTTTNRRGFENDSTVEAPEIIVTAPRDDGNKLVSATINGRHYGPGSRGPGASSTFTPLPDDEGRSLVTNPLTGRSCAPNTGSRHHIPEADDQNRNRIILEANILRALTTLPNTNATTNESRGIETANLLIAYTTKLLVDMDAQAKLDHENERKFLKRFNVVSVSFVVSTIVIGIYIGGGF